MWTKPKFKHVVMDKWYYDVYTSKKGVREVTAEVSREGWVLYLLGSRLENGYFECDYFLLLMDGINPIETYRVESDEFWAWPNMPPLWYVPF